MAMTLSPVTGRPVALATTLGHSLAVCSGSEDSEQFRLRAGLGQRRPVRGGRGGPAGSARTAEFPGSISTHMRFY